MGDGTHDKAHNLTHAKQLHDSYPNAQPLSLGESQILDILPNATVITQKSIKHTLTHFHWQLSLMTIPIDDELYHAINHALRVVNADFIWQKDFQGLGIPKAMEKLLS